MTDLKIPNLKKNSEKYLFKKGLHLRKKSKRKLIIESSYMFIFSFLLIYLNHLIPDKGILFGNFKTNIFAIFYLMNDLISYLFNVVLVFFILISLGISIILIIGAFNRIFKVVGRKTSRVFFK